MKWAPLIPLACGIVALTGCGGTGAQKPAVASKEDPPKPAYLYLKNGDVVRVDEVREFPDTMEYTISGSIHKLSPDSVMLISACGRDCVPGGGPTFNIIAIPLVARNKTDHSNHQASR